MKWDPKVICKGGGTANVEKKSITHRLLNCAISKIILDAACKIISYNLIYCRGKN